MTVCGPCRRRINLVRKKRAKGQPTLLTMALCDACKAANRKGGWGGDRTSAEFRARRGE